MSIVTTQATNFVIKVLHPFKITTDFQSSNPPPETMDQSDQSPPVFLKVIDIGIRIGWQTSKDAFESTTKKKVALTRRIVTFSKWLI